MDLVQSSNSGVKITKTMQVDSNKGTTKLECKKNAHESETTQENKTTEVTIDVNARFRPLIKVVQERNWMILKYLVDSTPGALTETVSEFGDTIFHIINVSDAPTLLIKKLAFKITAEELQNLRGDLGLSVMFHATILGYTNVVKVFVQRHTEFPNIRNGEGYLPIHEAAEAGYKGIIQYLLSETTVSLDDDKSVKLIKDLLSSGHYSALRQTIWHVLMLLVPDIKNIRDIKLTHMQTLDIVRILCHGNDVMWNSTEALETFWPAFPEAAKLRICETVNEILNAYFYAYTFRYTDNNYDLLHMAILHRQEKIFKFLKERNVSEPTWKAANKGGKTDNLLHLAGKWAASSQVSSAALQMQRELQWFEAVKSYVHPSLQEQQNMDDKTPRKVFIEGHKELVKQGEKWMKGTATSCSVVAALIITGVFTTVFTVPGGNNNDGILNFLHDIAFIVFVISDALALFSSTASVLMFLAILTSRYSEDDFLISLPRKLIIGLITLFFSITSMMVAFGATVYTFLSHSWNWTVIPISLFGCLPVTLFVILQFPLLVEIFLSTYRPSIPITPNK
ncbi:ankyrin repeat-containing protein ITN1-like [Pistacia vera]|uniref:ankyrin repeat-containing protein ITN1-like n=1 Tax=Pistacia vera TaxID=55513 RepID=UPI001263E665|nr:ankyrin repeat-containing protein ITN1-like [Pistacia vera]